MVHEWVNPPVTVSMLVVWSGKLLVCYHKERDLWDLPGGFLEPGETLEQCAIREALEETMLELDNPTYFGCTPTLYYDGRQILSVYFRSFWHSGTPTPTDEVQEFRWIDRPPDIDGYSMPKCDYDFIIKHFLERRGK